MGFAQGLNAGLNLVNGIAASRRENQQQAADAEKAQREKSQQELMDQANAAGRDAFKKYASQFDNHGGASAPAAGGAPLTLGAGSVPAPAQAGGGAAAVPGAAAGQGLGLSTGQASTSNQGRAHPAGKFDEREGILAGMTARRRALMDGGADPQVWMKDWGAESGLRAQLRSGALEAAEQRLSVTGDAGEYIRAVLPKFELGLDFVEAKRVKSPEGVDGWELAFKDQISGQAIRNQMSADGVRQFAATLRDPAAGMKLEAERLTEAIKAAAKIRAAEGEERAKQGTEKVKHGHKLEQTAAEGRESRRTVGARGAEDRRTNSSKPVTLGEGQVMVAPGKDGKYETKAEGKPKTLGSTSSPSAPNQILALRREASQAIAAGKDPDKVRDRFRELTGEDF